MSDCATLGLFERHGPFSGVGGTPRVLFPEPGVCLCKCFNGDSHFCKQGVRGGRLFCLWCILVCTRVFKLAKHCISWLVCYFFFDSCMNDVTCRVLSFIRVLTLLHSSILVQSESLFAFFR